MDQHRNALSSSLQVETGTSSWELNAIRLYTTVCVKSNMEYVVTAN